MQAGARPISLSRRCPFLFLTDDRIVLYTELCLLCVPTQRKRPVTWLLIALETFPKSTELCLQIPSAISPSTRQKEPRVFQAAGLEDNHVRYGS